MSESRMPSGRSEVTLFAPAERTNPKLLGEEIARACSSPVADAVLQAYGGIVMILNQQRQILAINATALHSLGVEDPEIVLGLRPGEALACTQLDQAPSGCGTGLACRSCGAVLSILGSTSGEQPMERECLLTSRLGGGELALEFKARATPLTVDNSLFIVLTLHSITDQKRCEALQHIFFHDISNLITALQGTCDTLHCTDPDELRVLVKGIKLMTARIAEEQAAQLNLLQIEDGNFEPHFVATSAEAILEKLRLSFSGHQLLDGRTLELPQTGLALPLHTDSILVHRVLHSLITNALEATAPGGVVRCWTEALGDEVCFKIHNTAEMPPEVALRVFQRSFSTKGIGRGLGTYSARLITQRGLDGRISFCSSAEGTTFSLRLARG